MRSFCLTVLLLAMGSTAFAQLDSDTLTITATRSVSLQPDQVAVTVYVSADLNRSFEDVVAAVQGVGITAANLTAVSPVSSQWFDVRGSQWSFLLPVAVTRLKDILTALTALQRAMAKRPSSMSLDFYVQGPQVSPELEAAQACPWPTLVSEARTQAQKVAALAGVSVGPILSVSQGGADASVPAVLDGEVFSVIPVVRATYFSTSSFSSLLLGTPRSQCAVTVQFKLVR